jgi:Holliday junction DNA helicase RuvA
VIGRLRGLVVHKEPPFALLDVGGVGYEIELTTGAFDRLPASGAEATVYTHMIVREDAHLLFGFASLTERQLFRDLIRVNGIGARMALAIVSGMSVAEFARCVDERDTAALMRLPGVGKKSAERLIVELRDRMAEYRLTVAPGDVAAARPAAEAGAADPVYEAMVALEALGYKPHEASRMVRALDLKGKSSEEILRGALQQAVVRTP